MAKKYSPKDIVNEDPYERFTLEELYSKDIHEFHIEWGHIGVGTKKELYPFISNLIDLLFDKDSKFENLSFNGLTILKDLGTEISSFGNAAGGKWEGEYKKLLVKDREGKFQTIGIGIFAGAKLENDRVFGNTRGSSYLIVAIENERKSHNSLQLNIDNNVQMINGVYYINHNGALTVSNKGAIKFNIVKDYIKKNAPYLLTSNNLIQLGIFPDKKLFLSSDESSVNLIKNLVEYAILRDEIRSNSLTTLNIKAQRSVQ